MKIRQLLEAEGPIKPQKIVRDAIKRYGGTVMGFYSDRLVQGRKYKSYGITFDKKLSKQQKETIEHVIKADLTKAGYIFREFSLVFNEGTRWTDDKRITVGWFHVKCHHKDDAAVDRKLINEWAANLRKEIKTIVTDNYHPSKIKYDRTERIDEIDIHIVFPMSKKDLPYSVLKNVMERQKSSYNLESDLSKEDWENLESHSLTPKHILNNIRIKILDKGIKSEPGFSKYSFHRTNSNIKFHGSLTFKKPNDKTP